MMLRFKQDDTAAALIITLTENVSQVDPFYLFEFTHVLTKDVVVFLKSDDDDESTFPERYNQFTIDPAVIFAGLPAGEWQYRVYEQASSSNIDPALSGAVLEFGKLFIDRATDFTYNIYDSPTTYKAYNG